MIGLIKLTTPDGNTIWVNMAYVGAIIEIPEGGCLFKFAHLDVSSQIVTETIREVFDRLSGRGGVDVPVSRIVKG